MKISDHTVYAPNRTPKFEKTSVSSVFSVVNEYTCGYVDNEIIINEVVATELGISKSQITGLGANGLIARSLNNT